MERPIDNPVKLDYVDGVCPDCLEEIPDDVQEFDNCINCGHMFVLLTDDDNEHNHSSSEL